MEGVFMKIAVRSLIIIGILLIILLPVTAFALSLTKQLNAVFSINAVIVDGKPIQLADDSQPFTVDGRTYLPVRAIAEALDKNVDYDAATATISITSKDKPSTAAKNVAIPISGVRFEAYHPDRDDDGTIKTSAVTIDEDEDTVSLTRLFENLEICWYIDDDGSPACAYRKLGGDWMHFFTEDATLRGGFGAGLYSDLFGYSGFYINNQRGGAYHAFDYYYFGADGKLHLLFNGTYLDAISDFNDDGATELLFFYHGGRDAEYFYAIDDDIFHFDIIGALSTNFSDWEYISADPLSVRGDSWATPESVSSKILLVNYQLEGADYYAKISFTQDEMIVSAGHKPQT
jgi:hypothetical protein